MSAKFHRLRPEGDPVAGMAPSKMVKPEDFLVSDPSETVHTAFRSREGNLTAGVWECSPCRSDIRRYGVDELCTVISGSVTITDRGGNAETFGPGDTFVMDRDFSGVWHITETLRKFWMIHEPKSG